MNDRLSFTDILTYGFRTLFWRPIHAAIYIGFWSLVLFAYYSWAQSDGALAYFESYAQSTVDVMQGNFAAYLAFVGQWMVIGLGIGAVYYAGAYRIMVREDPKPWLPVQIGLDELRMIGLFFVMIVFGLAFFLVAGLAFGLLAIVVTLLTSALFGGVEAGAGAAFAGLISVLAALCIYVVGFWAMGRFAVSIPLSIKQRRFSLGGWRASAGKGWSLFFAHLLIYLGIIAIQLLLTWELMSASFQQGMGPGYAIPPEELAQRMANPFGVWLIIAAPIQMLMAMLMLGPTAAIAAQADASGENEPGSV